MKNMKRYLTILIMICLIVNVFLTSCSSQKERMSTVSYSENEVKMPEGVDEVFDIKQIGKKTVRIVGLNESGTIGTVWDSVDEGRSWTQISTFTRNIKINKTKGITTEIAGYLSPKGQIFCVISEWQEGNDSKHKETYYIVENEQIKKININLARVEGGDNGVYNAEFANDGSLIIQDGFGQMYKVNQNTGKVQFTFLSEQMMDIFNPFSLYEDLMYIYTDKGLKAYSIKTGKEEKVDDSIKDFQGLEKKSIDYQRANFMVTDMKDDLVVYSIDQQGLKLYQNGKVKLLLEGNQLCLKSGMTSIYDFIRCDKRGLFLIAQTMNGSKLYHYR